MGQGILGRRTCTERCPSRGKHCGLLDAVALVPESTPPAVLARPQDGGVGRRDVSLDLLASFLRTILDGDKAVLIAEDELASPDAEWVQKQEFQFGQFMHDSNFYHWLPLSESISVTEISDFLDESTSGYPTNMFLLEGLSGATVAAQAEEELSPSEIIESVYAAIVSAYDDEAYIAAVRPR
jgi:hypothetical protein